MTDRYIISPQLERHSAPDSSNMRLLSDCLETLKEALEGMFAFIIGVKMCGVQMRDAIITCIPADLPFVVSCTIKSSIIEKCVTKSASSSMIKTNRGSIDFVF